MLTEAVAVRTATTRLTGELFVGKDGLPELQITSHERGLYRPYTLPAAWSLSSSTCGPLYTAWRDIEEIMEQLKAVQREEEKNDAN